MRETEADIRFVQDVMDATLARANPHMLSIVTPERRLNARQVCAYLQGTKHVALATVNSSGEPRVAPVDAVFICGRFTVGSGAGSARARNLGRNPACSAAHMVGEDVAVVVNGTAAELDEAHPDRDVVCTAWTEVYGSDPFTWGEAVVLWRIEPVSMWAYAPDPSSFPEEPAG